MNQVTDWERDVYAKGLSLNRWPFTELVSDLVHATRGRDPATVAVLELGCGAGNNLRFVLEHGCRAAGIDGSPSAIRVARERLGAVSGDRCDLRVGDVGTLPWPDASQDFVIDRGGLTCVRLETLPRVLTEVHRVLRPGGRFFSYDLFGMGNSDRKFGTEVAPQTYANFVRGRFEGAPPITFFDQDTIRNLWRGFRIDSLSRHLLTREGEDFVEERFSVKATREPVL
jgi:SAM-dependent methyltransferase